MPVSSGSGEGKAGFVVRSRDGESLSDIARKFGVAPENLADANPGLEASSDVVLPHHTSVTVPVKRKDKDVRASQSSEVAEPTEAAPTVLASVSMPLQSRRQPEPAPEKAEEAPASEGRNDDESVLCTTGGPLQLSDISLADGSVESPRRARSLGPPDVPKNISRLLYQLYSQLCMTSSSGSMSAIRGVPCGAVAVVAMHLNQFNSPLSLVQCIVSPDDVADEEGDTLDFASFSGAVMGHPLIAEMRTLDIVLREAVTSGSARRAIQDPLVGGTLSKKGPLIIGGLSSIDGALMSVFNQSQRGCSNRHESLAAVAALLRSAGVVGAQLPEGELWRVLYEVINTHDGTIRDVPLRYHQFQLLLLHIASASRDFGDDVAPLVSLAMKLSQS